jgi:hypothetical protein
MPTVTTTPVQIQDNSGEHTVSGIFHTTHFDQSDCLKRALMKLGLFWLLALGSLFIIFAHWVLVPGFFLAGPFMAYRTYQTKSTPTDIQGDCPVCNKAMDLKLEPKDVLPKWTYCPHCNVPLHITSADSGQG